MKNCKIAVFSCPIELRETETKGTILLENAEELQKLSSNEEVLYEELILGFKKNGVNVICSQMNFHELALHYCNKHGVMALKISSKYETKRFAVSVGAEINSICKKNDLLPVGLCSDIFVQEIGDKKVLVCRDDSDAKRQIASIVLRAATDNVLNDVGLAIGNGINVAKVAFT
jgi:T-complex protein 1 subunit theta